MPQVKVGDEGVGRGGGVELLSCESSAGHLSVPLAACIFLARGCHCRGHLCLRCWKRWRIISHACASQITDAHTRAAGGKMTRIIRGQAN